MEIVENVVRELNEHIKCYKLITGTRKQNSQTVKRQKTSIKKMFYGKVR